MSLVTPTPRLTFVLHLEWSRCLHLHLQQKRSACRINNVDGMGIPSHIHLLGWLSWQHNEDVGVLEDFSVASTQSLPRITARCCYGYPCGLRGCKSTLTLARFTTIPDTAGIEELVARICLSLKITLALHVHPFALFLAAI